jgi:hypothetical protein
MLTICSSYKLPRTHVKACRRSWLDRVTGGDFFSSHTIKKIPFVVKIDNKIYVHPENAVHVRHYLELHNLAYRDGETTFEPTKDEAIMLGAQ